MDNIEIVEIVSFGGMQTHIIIDRGNNEFTSMLKSTYDEMIAAQSTPSVE
jgi:hypothetical protein